MRARVGAIVEQKMCETYGLQHDHPGRADAQYSNGTPVEIKAAQRRKKNGRGGTKEGEFYIFEEPHTWLRRRDGYYVFCAYRVRGSGVQVLDTRRVHASKLPHFEFHESGHIGRNNDREARFKVSDIFG
jgi:hypothetical protein